MRILVDFKSQGEAEVFNTKIRLHSLYYLEICGFIIWTADPQLNLKDYIYSAACEV